MGLNHTGESKQFELITIRSQYTNLLTSGVKHCAMSYVHAHTTLIH